MNKQVIIVSHREIPRSNEMNYSECLETFFSDHYSSFPRNRRGEAPIDIYLPKAKELVEKFQIGVKIEDGWGLDRVFEEIGNLVKENAEKINELVTWYNEMKHYSVSEIDHSSLCEDLFDDHIEKKLMTVKNRCSVWEHKESNDVYALYAVFPLRSANKDWPQTLINAVKEINKNPIGEILLLLHDHDLYNNYTPFQLDDSLSKSLSNNNGQKITLAVFQHINKKMSFLVNEQHSPEEIFNHYSKILGETQEIIDAHSNDIVYKGYFKRLKKNYHQ